MKTTFFIPYLTDGGVTRSTYNLARCFVAKGHQVEFLCVKLAGDMALSIQNQSEINVTVLNARRALFALPRLKRHFERAKPDVVISAQHYANIISVWARMLSRHKPKLIATERVHIHSDLSQLPVWKMRVLNWLVRRFYKRADHIVVNSKSGARALRDFIDDRAGKVKTIYNCVDFENIRQLAQADLRHPFLNKSAPLIVSVGRLERQKGFDILLQAFAKLRRRLKANLIIVGDGELTGELRALTAKLGLNDCVSLPGFDVNPYRYMKNADLFVCSSRYEGFGNVLPEAQACDTLVASTDCPVGPNEILMDGAAGLLAASADADSLERTIWDALNLPPDRAAAIIGVARDNLSRFGRDEICDSYTRLMTDEER